MSDTRRLDGRGIGIGDVKLSGFCEQSSSANASAAATCQKRLRPMSTQLSSVINRAHREGARVPEAKQSHIGHSDHQ